MIKGIVFIILSGICFLIVNFFVKLFGPNGSSVWLNLNVQEIPAHELVLARSLVSFALSSIIIKYRGYPFFGVNKKWLFIRGLSGTIALTIFFMTLQHLPFAIAAVILYLAPIFTMFFTMLLIGDRIFKIQWLFVTLAFFGVALISLEDILGTNNSLSIDYFWLGWGVLSASISGVAYTSIVKLKETDHPINIVLYFPMVSIPFMMLWCMFDYVHPIGIEWLFLLIIGLFTQFAQILLTKALHFGHASVIIPFQYLGIVYALLIGFFIFDERLHLVAYIGVFLILCGVLLNTLYRHLNKKTV